MHGLPQLLVPSSLRVTISGDRLAIPDDDVSSLVNRVPFELLCGISHSKGMSSAAAALTGATFLVFPIRFLQKNHVNAPDDHWLALFKRLCWIDQIPPDDVPAGMVIMRLYGPRPFTRFALKAVVWV